MTWHETFGILEHVLSYCNTHDLLQACAVNRRWKQAGRMDSLWQAAFVQSIFDHPLLKEKQRLLKDSMETADLQRFLQVHMLDIMSAPSPTTMPFFANIWFGSYASAVLDSKRTSISKEELCTPFGFHMYFKIAVEEVVEEDQEFLTEYTDGTLLYHHSTCFFEAESKNFRMVLHHHVHSYHPTDLQWRWLKVGERLQVGPYPPLTVARQKDWGWKLENLHVVLMLRDQE